MCVVLLKRSPPKAPDERTPLVKPAQHKRRPTLVREQMLRDLVKTAKYQAGFFFSIEFWPILMLNLHLRVAVGM